MKSHYIKNDWKIIEDHFSSAHQKGSESIFSIGNGRMGQRANFEEDYSGETLQGTYIGGVYYPDKTRVGWWKNGYPEYFAKVLNAPNFTGIHVMVQDELLDLHTWTTDVFERVLDMQKGILSRTFTATSPNGNQVRVTAERFLSMSEHEIAAIQYTITPINFSGDIMLTPYINGAVVNEDSNYDESFWNVLLTENKKDNFLLAQTRKLDFQVCMSMQNQVFIEGKPLSNKPDQQSNETKIQSTYLCHVKQGEKVRLEKFVAVTSSLNHTKDELVANAVKQAQTAINTGYESLKSAQIKWWDKKWEGCDIEIKGDVGAQQAIRFNIFQLTQTYTGDDPRLNVGPKGFTGEKYGGSTYWDTEAYCVPFYLGTAQSDITRNLLIYRHKQLDRAIENAAKLGFNSGAALYPMVTMNGEECHNEWEITFEEIHRNGAIAYAIYNYVNYTGDKTYYGQYGLEVLIGIARFWAQRTNFSNEKGKYVILGVTGPNEYENNVNNNWYTNYLAAWCLRFAKEVFAIVQHSDAKQLENIIQKTKFDTSELQQWQNVYENMYYPKLADSNIYLQQDGFMDKEQILASDIPIEQRPINQHWSWDRILRSPFIKQADVLQGLFFFEHEFDKETLKNNFDFYEPRTVHESSLSPCVHSILASSLQMHDKAYELFLRTSRLDLDDYNKEVDEGLHITSMAGTWMSVIQGFGGVRVKNGILSFHPTVPKNWEWYSFKLNFRNRIIQVKVTPNEVFISLEHGAPLKILLNGNELTI